MIIDALIKSKVKKSDHPILMVCPHINKLPEEDVLSFTTVTEPAELFVSHPRNTVLMFTDEMFDLLQLWNQNQDTLQLSMLVVLDIPGANYDGEFSECTTRSAKTTYHGLIGDLSEAARRAEAAGEAPTQYQTEQDRITRKSGMVKEIEDDDFDTDID